MSDAHEMTTALRTLFRRINFSDRGILAKRMAPELNKAVQRVAFEAFDRGRIHGREGFGSRKEVDALCDAARRAFIRALREDT